MSSQQLLGPKKTVEFELNGVLDFVRLWILAFPGGYEKDRGFMEPPVVAHAEVGWLE